MAVTRILITGFDAFGGEGVNPAGRAVHSLASVRCGDVEVISREIPTVFDKSARVVREAVQELSPDAVILVGQAGGVHAIQVERVALNLDDARIPDNEGNQPVDSPIEPAGPAAYWATLPVRETVKAIRKKGIPAVISYSAGTFVCNHVFYSTCHFVATNMLPVRVGFIHVPYLPEQAVEKEKAPSMSEDCIVAALEVAVDTVACAVEGAITGTGTSAAAGAVSDHVLMEMIGKCIR